MDGIPLTFFVDFVLTAGMGRLAAARHLKEDNHTDLYRAVRDTIVDMHRKPHIYAGVLDRLLDSSSPLDPRERRIFPKVVAGYQRFLKQGQMRWFEPPLRNWPLGPLALRVAPELGLLIDGRPHAIQLYFRAAPPSDDYVRLTTAILHSALAPTWPGTVFALLDVRRAKLYPHRRETDTLPLLRAEAGALSSLLGAL